MTKSNKRPKALSSPPPDTRIIPNPPSASDPLMIRRPLFVASLGNPPPQYKNTLHSAGHTLLTTVQQSLSYPPFAKSRAHGNGLLSRGDDMTLWQSPTLMNVSGPAVASAWKTFLQDLPSDDLKWANLVIVHDELESRLGEMKIRIGGSTRGHNGLKSVVKSLGGDVFVRIGVGIGRPESRNSNDVAAYVLRKMSVVEMQKVNQVAEEVVAFLSRMSNRQVGEVLRR